MASLPYPRLRHNPPTDSTDFHRWNLYKELPQNSEVLIQRTPTDSTDFHRWDLYKELPQNSRNSQKFRCIYCSVSMAGMPYHPIHLCKSVESVGVFSISISVNSVKSVGVFSISTSVNSVESVGVFSISTSVNSVKSVGVFLYKYFREFREICGSFSL